MKTILDEIAKAAFIEAGLLTIKMLVSMIDLDRLQINMDLSYSIQIIKNCQIITKEDLKGIVAKAFETGGDTVKQNGNVPDQSK
jgi:hypothetical protein